MAPNSTPRVLVTRSQQQSSELAARLRALGLEPVTVPVIEIAAPASFDRLDAALRGICGFDWIVFTSANAVEAVRGRWESAGLHDASGPGKPPRIAAIGPATARALAGVGLAANLVPPQAVAESLAEELVRVARRPDGSPGRFLLLRAEEARDVVPDTLRSAGAEVVIAPAYRTVLPAGSAETIRSLFAGPAQIAAVTFTSSSTARNLFALCASAGVVLPDYVLRVSIGPITSETLRSLGYPPHAEAPSASVISLAETVRSSLEAARGETGV